MPYPAGTIEDMYKVMTGPGSPLETTQAVVKGHKYTVYKNLPPSIGAMWYNTASTHFDREYIIHNDTRLTYKQVHLQVELVGQKLVDCGVKKGDKVAIVSRNSPEFVVAYWATHMLGAVSVLVNAWQTKPVILACLHKTRPKVVVVDDQRAGSALEGEDLSQLGVVSAVVAKPTRSYRGLQSWGEWVPKPGRFPALPSLGSLNIQPEDEATIYFTSGTTGLPKAVLSTQRQNLSNCFNVLWTFLRGKVRRGEPMQMPSPQDPQKVYLLAIPLFHVTGNATYLHLYTVSGAKIVIMDKWNPKTAMQLVEKEKVTNMGGVPSQTAEILQEKGDFSSVKGIGYGGAPPTTQLPKRARSVLAQDAVITHAYGLTETNAVAFGNSDEDYLKHPDSIGTPSPVNEAKIVDSNGNEVPHGQVGELWMRGPNVCEGYYGDPEATKKSFDKDHWFASGDMACRDEEGFFYIRDRLKDVIIRGGENIAGGAVENAIYKDERVLHCAAVGVPDPKLGELVAAMVHFKEEYRGKATAEDVIKVVAQHLPKHEVPVFIHITDEPLPLNALGKIQKRDLKKEVARLYAQSKRQSKL